MQETGFHMGDTFFHARLFISISALIVSKTKVKAAAYGCNVTIKNRVVKMPRAKEILAFDFNQNWH